MLIAGFPGLVRLSLTVDLHDGNVPVEDVRSSLHAAAEEPRTATGESGFFPASGWIAISSCGSGSAMRTSGPH